LSCFRYLRRKLADSGVHGVQPPVRVVNRVANQARNYNDQGGK
jgi:hypothetical protein